METKLMKSTAKSEGWVFFREHSFCSNRCLTRFNSFE